MADRKTPQNCCTPDRQTTTKAIGDDYAPVNDLESPQSTNRDSFTQSRNHRGALASIIDNQFSAPPVIDTVCVGGDWFDMGCAQSPHPEDGEGPVRSVWVDQFRLATTAVSNREFQHFVDATGYQTNAERAGSSFVFHLLLEDASTGSVSGVAPWWRDVSGACWYRPEGLHSSVEHRWDHPVVHITRDDALRYCQWSSTRLATEAEWEYAARGGFASQPYPWGAELIPDGRHRCNIWQGEFPHINTCCDGFPGTAPVRQYEGNSYGLFNMTGNVWEWVADRFTNMHSPRETKNPKGPLNGNRFVAKGGSYLCHESYCLRYRTSSRQALTGTVSAGNLGFRVAVDVIAQHASTLTHD